MASSHFTPEQLTERFELSSRIRNIVYGLVGVGVILVLIGAFLAQSGDGHHDDSHGEEHAELITENPTIHTVANDQHDDGHGEDSHGDDGHADEAHAGDDHGHTDAAHAEAHGDDGHGGGHGHHGPTWVTRVLTGFYMSNLYFITIAMGALFFIAVHRVGNAGWQTAIRRVPEAMFGWLPFAAIGAAASFLFMDQIFEWIIIPEGQDALIDTKRAYLNPTGFIIRSIIFFGVWILVARVLRRLSTREDTLGGLQNFEKSLGVSAGFVVFFAISYSLFAIDWIKSLEPHWFSTIFGVYTFAGSMASAMATLTILVYFLRRQGYMKYVNDSHAQDINTYMLGFSIFWAYMWVSQFLLIWYSNIPEETIYYAKRWRTEDSAYLGYAPFFYLNLILNFILPFLGMLNRNARRDPRFYIPIACIILIGHWNDLFQMVMPGVMFDQAKIGMLEIGWFMIFAGLFLLVVFRGLSKANLVPLKHPYLEESLHHTTGDV
ncbi:MAG: quinol:cytochrome C oxidoreductase [Bacteroidota bacterium]